jgi:hypothetical protein
MVGHYMQRRVLQEREKGERRQNEDTDTTHYVQTDMILKREENKLPP